MISLSDQNSFVFYQSPNSDEISYLKGNWEKIDLNSNPTSEGFIISNADKSSTYFMEGEASLISTQFQIDINQKEAKQKELNKDEYLNKAYQFTAACKNDLKKVILSRIKKQHKKEENIYNTFQKICKTYNHSFNFLFNIPNIGTWMGATPEILINGNNHTYKTVSLAGSKPTLSDLTWGGKEKEEQQFVTNYIADKLNSNNILNDFNDIPETVIAGNIAHLKTTFTINTKKNPLELANLLHPTPAVCGIPQKKAQQYINENEGYNREFYTGFLGSTNQQGCNLFVNLRCMKVFQNEYWLYVGGGITKDSIAEKEWEETELKAQTLLNILD